MMTTKFKFLFASLALAGITTLSAQTVGYVSSTINPGTNTISLTFKGSVPSGFVGQSSGALTGVTSNTVTNSAAGWTSGFATASTPYLVRFTSGTAAGRTFQISSATSTVLTLSVGTDNLVTLGVVVGDTYDIFPAETLGTLFGQVAGLQSGANSAAADNALIWTGSTWNTYWWDGTNWRLGTSPTSRSNTILSPDGALIFVRRGATPLTFTVSGRVPDENIKVALVSGLTPLSGIYPVDKTLGTLDVELTSGWKSVDGTTVPNSTTADRVLLWTGSTWNSYYYDVTFTPARWRLGTSPSDRSSTIIAAGVPVLVSKSSAATVFNTTKPY